MREFIVEADGGSRGNPGPAGYGAVVLDAATGDTLAEAAAFLGVATNNVAEYQGLLAGLRAARALDPAARVRVRMDSKLVVEQMSGRWQVKHPALRPLAAEAARVFPGELVAYEWIPRARNKHADRLANEAMDAGARGEQWSAATSTAELDARAGAGAGAAGGLTEGAPLESALPVGDSAAAARGGVDERTSRTGERAARSGEPTSLSGERAAPSAERTSRTGERAARSDEPTSPTGEREARTGARAPSGEGEARTGEGAWSGERAAARTDDRARTDERARADARARSDERAARTVASPGWAPVDLGAPATFVLLRHGETPLTPQKRFSGSGGSDPSLSEAGREQAEKAAAALAGLGTIQAVVSSPLARTRETAGIVADRLGLDVAVDDGLRETDFGAWEGMTFGEVRERYPDDLNAWLASAEAEPTGGGESFAATAERIGAARDRLVAAYAGRTVLLVTHVTPIKTLVRLALGAPPESLFRMELSAASMSAVAYYADGNASVRLLNDTSHLR
ncbi:bifunctional RNase H/acid phosphatase [Streptomyces sp. NPDC046985]|uniref:bifunctional RNase H/acid phosphatase n=1 Tax=Streptomyces sp. NPDC046985 TaxID=3155377 RepID=UPI0033C3C6AF